MNKVYHNDQEFVFPANVISVNPTESGLDVLTEDGLFVIVSNYCDCGCGESTPYATAK